MAIALTTDNNFKINGDFIYDLLQLTESVQKDDMSSLILLCGKIAQRMESYDLSKNLLPTSSSPETEYKNLSTRISKLEQFMFEQKYGDGTIEKPRMF